MADPRRAAKAFEDFTGRKPRRARVARLDDHNVAGWEMGPVVGVAYEAVRDGVRKQYFHEFKKAARPNLVARDDGRQLYFEGGRYKVTDRGIEDMPQLFVVNPSSRVGARKKATPMARRRRSASRRRRAPAQVAVFRTNPSRRRRRRSYARNPAPVRRRRRRASVRRYASNPVRRRRSVRRRYARNPSARGMFGQFSKFLIPAAGIGAGAVGTEIIMAHLPIPANLKVGVMRQVTKGAVGVTLGLVMGRLFKQKRLGQYFALGAIAIAVHDGIKDYITGAYPKVGFGGVGQYLPRGRMPSSIGYYNPGQVRMGAGMGMYVPSIASSFAGASTQRGDGSVDPDYYV